jgi:hypothetical protein
MTQTGLIDSIIDWSYWFNHWRPCFEYLFIQGGEAWHTHDQNFATQLRYPSTCWTLKLPFHDWQTQLFGPEHLTWYCFCSPPVCPILLKSMHQSWHCHQMHWPLPENNCNQRINLAPWWHQFAACLLWFWLLRHMDRQECPPLWLSSLSLHRLCYHLLQLPHLLGWQTTDRGSPQHLWV